jgi:hypothetical protein
MSTATQAPYCHCCPVCGHTAVPVASPIESPHESLGFPDVCLCLKCGVLSYAWEGRVTLEPLRPEDVRALMESPFWKQIEFRQRIIRLQATSMGAGWPAYRETDCTGCRAPSVRTDNDLGTDAPAALPKWPTRAGWALRLMWLAIGAGAGVSVVFWALSFVWMWRGM